MYYLYEYAHSFYLHGDGVPLLLYYEDECCRLCYVVMKKDIADANCFKDRIPKNKFFDLETPYGYGGPLVDLSIVPEESQIEFRSGLKSFCVKHGIVSQFVRFHPLLGNYKYLPLVIEGRCLRDTIYIDTSDAALIEKNMDAKHRNTVRKAERMGVTVIQKSISEYEPFMEMYYETMIRDAADEYYVFNEQYFSSLKALGDNACIFYAELEGKLISGAIMLFNNNFMHYHLAGTYDQYKNVSPSNLLLREAGLWAAQNGITRFHLGGGVSADDSLFKFKKKFNKYGRLSFVVGRTIFDKDSYDYLLDIRERLDGTFDRDNSFMIQYRR